jgi:3-methyl-2-oxobutanoate hydroxymethyltransferase
MKITTLDFKSSKTNKKKITMLTAYDYSMATLFDRCGIDSILVGDSLGMVQLGYENTLPVTLDDIIYHTKSVRKGVKNALLVSDMPFMSYQTSVYDAVKNAGRIIQEGFAEAVKLEGGREVVEQIKAIISSQIPVMGHIGLTPQSVNILGGFKVQGKSYDVATKIIEDAKIIEQAGAFAVVLECIPYKLARLISDSISIPTIGIGSGKYCDGQILVYHDMLNITTDSQPKKFVKIFNDVGEAICKGVTAYINNVNEESFPEKENSFCIDEDIINNLKSSKE